jgi:arylsulfatase
MVAGDKTLWEQTLAPARDLGQRGWQEVLLPCETVLGERVALNSNARDYGALVTPLEASRPDSRPRVIFILVDALRPDHLGAYGYSRPTSPNLDTLAASGVRFENAITASVFTLTSVASIFTGRYPWEHGVIFTRNLHLPASLPVLAQEFQKQGYSTAAFSGTYFRFSLEGFDRGFQVFDESCAQAFFRDSADCLNRSALPWLQAHADEPFFLYLHYVDTHAPYYAPEPFRHRFTQGHRPDHNAAGLGDAARFGDGRKWFQVPLRPTPADLEYLKDLYDGEIAYADARIGEILKFLRQSGQMDSTFILVTADHGEAFQEHGELEHRKTLYDEALKVPLILAGPGLPRGKVIIAQVRTLDFGATLLGLAFDDRIILGEGRSLKPLGEGLPLAPEPALAAAYLGKEQRIYALRAPEWKLIVRYPGRNLELYHLADDPLEKRNLAPQHPPQLDLLFQNLQTSCPEAN